FGVAFVTFVIVLAARSPAGVTKRDAGALAAAPADAGADSPSDATVAIAIDAPLEPTFRLDAGPTTLLEVRTKPAGATIKIGDQTRVAPAQFALSAGKHNVIAELDGWVAEKRTIDLIVGDHLVHEIAFTRRVGTVRPPQPKTGRFVARTNPYSDVYEGIRKIAQTPCDIELPAGKHTLLFKNPNHKTVYKTVVIQPGKPVKLSFDLPQ
ncbi:MAG TPA: PEGA domain-containing protein, partial [Kofleriaceae bacterium]